MADKGAQFFRVPIRLNPLADSVIVFASVACSLVRLLPFAGQPRHEQSRKRAFRNAAARFNMGVRQELQLVEAVIFEVANDRHEGFFV